MLLAVRRRWKGVAKVNKVFGMYRRVLREDVPLQPNLFLHEKCHRTLLDPELPEVAAFVPG